MPHAALQLAINTPPLPINVIGTRILASAGLNVEILRQKFLRLRLLVDFTLANPNGFWVVGKRRPAKTRAKMWGLLVAVLSGPNTKSPKVT